MQSLVGIDDSRQSMHGLYSLGKASRGTFITITLTGWVYYHIYNAMQYSNTALEATAM